MARTKGAKNKPKKSNNPFTADELIKAFKRAKKKHDKKAILDVLVDKAYDDPTLALALLKKIWADKRSKEDFINEEVEGVEQTPSEAAEEMDRLTATPPEEEDV